MTLFDKLTQERRARLIAERQLDQRMREVEGLRRDLDRALTDLHLARRQSRPSAPAPLPPEPATADRDRIEAARAEAAQAERRLWESVNTIWDGFAVFDARLRLVIANQSYLNFFRAFPEVQPGIGYERLAEILAYEGLVDLEGGDPRAWVDAGVARLGLDPIPQLDIRMTAGPILRLHERRARGGDLVLLARDITESVRHAEELREARIRAESASRAKSAFLANMSHEIRTPMNGVVGMAELLAETTLSEEQRLYVDTIRTSGEALLAIINDVLDFSKIEADRLTLHPEPFDLERCIHEVLVLLQAVARKRRIELLLDYDLFLPTRFLADPGRMRQVLTNLVGNAVKFTEKGHVLIRVVGAEAGEGRRQLSITVEDTGIGIAPEHQSRIFGEFAQVEDQASRRFQGTGLGLTISRRLVELMGGRIWVESEVGQGSCFGFSVTLPVAEAEGPDRSMPPGFDRVLVADPSPINRAILVRQLQALGLTVEGVAGRAEAFDRLNGPDGGFDLVVIDHAPPGLDAWAMARALAAAADPATGAAPVPPVLLMTTGLTEQGQNEGHPAVRGVLQKPVLRRDLLRQFEGMVAPAPLAPPRPAARPAAARPGAGRALRVLAAEDNRTNQLVLSKMCEGLELELVFAEDGQVAVDLFPRLRPDLILMDISMPRMDGRAATRAIRQMPGGAQVPILALTAHAVGADHVDILDSGVDDVLTKPLRKARLLEAITRHAPPGLRPVQPGSAADPPQARTG